MRVICLVTTFTGSPEGPVKNDPGASIEVDQEEAISLIERGLAKKAPSSSKPDNHARSASKVDINSADAEKLSKVDGIGPELADAIIAARPFFDIDELKKISGIGSGKLKKIAGQISV